MSDNTVHIYTDGGCRGNQTKNNIGAYGAILHFNGHKKSVAMAFRNVTNNQMEIRAVIEGLKAMKRYDLPIRVYSDSAYVVNAINKRWIDGWAKNGWVKKDGKIVANRELFMELRGLIKEFDDFEIIKVKGHDINEGNNEVDALVNFEMDKLSVESED